MRIAFLAAPLVATALVLAASCGGKKEAASPGGSGSATAPVMTSTITPPVAADCKDAPLDPGAVIAKEPGVFNACLADAGKMGASLCGSAKIDIKVGRDGKVQDAQVAQSTLPVGVTDCIKTRLAAMTFACPSTDSAVYSVPIGLPFGGAAGGGCPSLPGASSLR